MQTVVLADDEGSRMGPLTDRVPRAALPVGDRPLVVHALDAAVRAGASRIVLVVGAEGTVVRDHVGDAYTGVPVEYARPEGDGTAADAVGAATASLDDGPFAVLNGGALYDASSLSDLFANRPSVATYRADEPIEYGVLQVEEGADRVTGVVTEPSAPPSSLVNAGAYVFPTVAREWIETSGSDRGDLGLADVLERTCVDRDVRPIELDRWLDVGRPWDLLEANEWKLGEYDRRIEGDVHEDAELRGTVVVEDGATVDAGVVIEGPVMIRSGASVGPNTFVRGATLIGPDASVGHAVEVKNSVLMAGTTVNHLSSVGDSVLGRDAKLGAGTQIANERHDGAAVELAIDGERVSTDRRKFGAVLGDGAVTGVNASLDAGVTLSTGAGVKPGEAVLRDR